MSFCAFPGCDNPPSPKAAKGLCNSHYWQLHKGRELTPLSYRRNRSVPWLEAHVDHEGDECLTWPFKPTTNGRGQVKYRGKMMVASRLMCILAHGAPPTPEHEAAHSCGKGHEGCVNPMHLRWATDVENKADMVGHGTRIQGEQHYAAKLSTADVRQIRDLSGQMSQSKLGDRFDVRASTIAKIVLRQRWSHVS